MRRYVYALAAATIMSVAMPVMAEETSTEEETSIEVDSTEESGTGEDRASEIEKLIQETLTETSESQFIKTGKNIYVTNYEKNMRITINSNTYRLITVDKIEKLNRDCNRQIQKE